MNDSPIAVIADSTGNLVPALSDGVNNRLAVDARISGSSGLQASVVQDGPSSRRLQVDAKTLGVTGGNFVNRYLLNGSNSSLIVNGATTNVSFSYAPSSSQTATVTSISVFIEASTLSFSGAKFLNAGAMTNGLALYVTTNGVQSIYTTFKINEDFIALSNSNIYWPSAGGGLLGGGTNGVLACTINTSLALSGATGDACGIIVRDNLTSTGGNLIVCNASLQGYVAS